MGRPWRRSRTSASLAQITTVAQHLWSLVQSGREFTGDGISKVRLLLEGSLRIRRENRSDAVRHLLIGLSLFQPLDIRRSSRLIELSEIPQTKSPIAAHPSYAPTPWIKGYLIETFLNAFEDLASSVG